jgi:insulin receptor
VIYNQTCIAQCPSGLFTFHSSRCITKDQCHTVGIPHIDIHDFEEEYKLWRVFNGSCVPNCPPGYEEHQLNNEDGVTLTCKTCGKGGCRKVCMSNKIDSIAKAYNLKGCTHINTSLEIQINGGKDMSQELEESLGSIEEIDGYLKITRSFTLLNLNFLRNLRIIHGNPLESGKYSLTVMNNQNLQELWNWSARSSSKLQLGNGTILFHKNPKLCMREIHNLEAAAGLKRSSITEQEVSSLSNGDEVECIVVDLQAKVTKKLVSGVLLEWEVSFASLGLIFFHYVFLSDFSQFFL